jgi:DNA-binding winged helix-turn-helix (wHTH) protein/Tol biopolymer transport system component
MPARSQPGPVRFGVFELDVRAAELRKNGIKLRLQEQPFRVLAVLLEQPGEVVTREELKEKLWPDDTFVDFDNSLNTAVNKLRDVLGDSAVSPRFVETVPRRGYRFLAPVAARAEAPAEAVSLPDSNAVPDHCLRLQRNGLVGALGLALGVILFTQVRQTDPPPPTPVRRFAFTPQQPADSPVISPNGRHIAYITGLGAQASLWVQDLDQDRPRVIPGAEGSRRPFWSPDSTTIGFFADEELRRVSIAGGEAQTICRLPANSWVSGTWSRDGESIIFGDIPNIYEVAARGGTPRVLIGAEPGGDIEHVEEPQLLPEKNGHRGLLFMLKRRGPGHYIAVQSLETGERQILEMPALSHFSPFYSPTGHIVYVAVGAGPRQVLEARPFSLETLSVTGDAFPIRGQGTFLSVADDGTLVYLEDTRYTAASQFVWRDRTGKRVGEVGQLRQWFNQFTVSRDGSRVIINDWGEGLGIYDMVRQTFNQLPSYQEGLRPVLAVLAPDASRVAFGAVRKDNTDIYIQPLEGGLSEQPVVATALNELPADWSPDGKFLAYEVLDPKNNHDVWYLYGNDDGSYDSKPFLQTRFDETQASFSPDGRFLAYVSDESGRSEVYVQSFPQGESKLQVSFKGGEGPKWSRDGKELFYIAGEMLVAAAIEMNPPLSVRSTQPLFNYLATSDDPVFEVSEDGKRFLMVERAGDTPKPVIRVVQTLYGVLAAPSPR